MNEIKRALLRKLVRHGYWGSPHTNVDNLHKGFPSHLHKEVKNVTKDLIKKGTLLVKPTSYGMEVSLNPRKRKEIELILKGEQ